MIYELPCSIVQELLPNYIDGLSGTDAAESIRAHLANCPDCRAQYDTMQGSCRLPAETSDPLLKKLKSRLNRRLVMAVTTCLLIAALGIGGLLFGVYAPVKEIPPETLKASCEVYETAKLAPGDPQGAMTYISVSENDSGAECYDIPGVSGICLTPALIEQNPYVSVITIETKYRFADMHVELEARGGRHIYVLSAKTMLLNNTFDPDVCVATSLEFQKTDEVVFRSSDGTETVLWRAK